MAIEIDLKAAINAISDVIQNRPRPLRHVDQIYMKAGDMVMQSEMVAKWANGKRLAFIGDGDAISVCVAFLKHKGILEYGPSEITVFDFDERITSSIARFADAEKIPTLRSELYNCLDPLPDHHIGGFQSFYTNPPWGASNQGESVKVFMQRGFEVTRYAGSGMIVIADDTELPWPQQVLAASQLFALEAGHYVQKMQPQLHLYHLDDNPELKSCNLIVRALPGNGRTTHSEAITDPQRLANFYGKNKGPRIHFIMEKKKVDYGKAHDDEFYDVNYPDPEAAEK